MEVWIRKNLENMDNYVPERDVLEDGANRIFYFEIIRFKSRKMKD